MVSKSIGFASFFLAKIGRENWFPIWLACTICFFQWLSGPKKNKHQTLKHWIKVMVSTQSPTPTTIPQLLIQTWLPYWLSPLVLVVWYRITLHINLAKRSHKSWPQLLGKLKGWWRRWEREDGWRLLERWRWMVRYGCWGNCAYYLPVVPHKAVAEVSRTGNYRKDWLLWVTDGRAKTLMDRTV